MASTADVFFPRELDAKSFYNTPEKLTDYGTYQSWINYDDGERKEKTIYIQSPWMFNIFGIGTSQPKEGEEPSYSIEPSLGRKESRTESMDEFRQFFTDYDDRMIEIACDNPQWFDKNTKNEKLDPALAKAFYKSCVRENVNPETGEEYPNTMRFKIPRATNKDGTPGEFLVQIFDETNPEEPVIIDTPDELFAACPQYGLVRVIFRVKSTWIGIWTRKCGWSI